MFLKLHNTHVVIYDIIVISVTVHIVINRFITADTITN